MSPSIIVEKKRPASKNGEGLTSRDWLWVGLAILSAWLLLTGLHRLFNTQPALPTQPAPLTAEPPKEDLSPPPEPPPPMPAQRTFLMHSEAVRETVKSLREHARECPNAPDVLTEEQIKAIEQQGHLIL